MRETVNVGFRREATFCDCPSVPSNQFKRIMRKILRQSQRHTPAQGWPIAKLSDLGPLGRSERSNFFVSLAPATVRRRHFVPNLWPGLSRALLSLGLRFSTRRRQALQRLGLGLVISSAPGSDMPQVDHSLLYLKRSRPSLRWSPSAFHEPCRFTQAPCGSSFATTKFLALPRPMNFYGNWTIKSGNHSSQLARTAS